MASKDDKVNVAIIGLGFGAEFIPIYQAHAQVNMYAICRRDQEELNRIGDACGIEKRFTQYEDVLADPSVDYVHINSPIADHAWMSIAALPWPRLWRSVRRSCSWSRTPVSST